MGEGERKPTSVKFTPENLEYLKNLKGGNVTENINEIAEKFRTGKLVEIGTILTGADGKGCIQPLMYEKAPECPFRVAYPQLQQAKNGLVLQNEFCVKCPYYKRDFEKFKSTLRRPLTSPRPEAPPQPTVEQKRAQTLATINAELDKDTATPAKPEVKKVQQATRITELPPDQALVGCDNCHETFIFDDVTAALDDFLVHIEVKHGRKDVSGNEANQFRHARTRLEKAKKQQEGATSA